MYKQKLKTLWLLFFTFFKIGAFTFGGGYAMIPLIQREIADNRKWITEKDILDIIAIAESTPGPIAINSATFVGFKVAGFWGAFCATFGVVLPSFLIILILAPILRAFREAKPVQYAFMGIRAGVLALVMKALYNMYRQCPKHLFSYCIMAGAFLATAIFDLPVLAVIIGCALCGVVYALLAKRREEK